MNTLVKWLENQRQLCDMKVKEIPWNQSQEWLIDNDNVRHQSGRFFKIIGATVIQNNQRQSQFGQPLIDQWEIGILGFMIRKKENQLEILVQAKPEPGNIGLVQAAPTVQATESNYKKVHQGKDTPFLDYFLQPEKRSLISNNLQSEQGTRFLAKYNRNMIVEIQNEFSQNLPKAYQWIPIQNFLSLLLKDFQINTDARSAITSSVWSRLVSNLKPFSRWRNKKTIGNDFLQSYEILENKSVFSEQEIFDRLKRYRHIAKFSTKVISLKDLPDWKMTKAAFKSKQKKCCEIRQFKISSSERETLSWDQPLIVSPNEGTAILYAQKRNGILHFLFSCQEEIGFRERCQYGPTIQEGDSQPDIFPELSHQKDQLKNYLRQAKRLLSNLQSDEGGRFFQCISRYSIYLLNQDVQVDLGQNLIWINLKQIEKLVQTQGVFSNEARTLISMILAYL